MNGVDTIIRYLARLQHTGEVSHTLGGDQGVRMVCTVDTSYASDAEDYRSMAGATIHMASNTGSMLTMCSKQTICADSSMSAEGKGCHLLVCRVLPIRYFFKRAGIRSKYSHCHIYG